MYTSVLILLYSVCLPLISSAASTTEITFRNVVVQLILGPEWADIKSIKTVRSANNLAERLPTTKKYDFVKIEDQHIPVLYDNSISGLNVTKLAIIKCDLREIKPKAFLHADLMWLTLNGNHFERISSGTFSHAKYYALNLAGNQIRVIEPGAFAHTDLYDLDLGGNNLELIPEGCFANTSIMNLNLNFNRLKRIPPESFRNIAELRELSLSHNQLEDINDIFTDMPAILRLTLDNNKIAQLDAGVFRNTFITYPYCELRLDNNKIRTIKGGAFDGTNLYNLNLTLNEITRIEQGAFNISDNGHIDLSFNKLEEVRRGIFENMHVQDLVLCCNEITSIEPEAFSNSYVARLRLQRNNLEEIRRRTFKNARVKVLSLFENKIHDLEPGAFEGLEVQIRVDLHSNDLSEIREGVLDVALKAVNLTDNNITKIDGAIGDGKSHMVLYLGNNPVDASALNSSLVAIL